MRDNWQQKLKQELKQAGAKTSEVDELVPIAANLRLLKVSRTGTQAQPYVRRGWLRFLRPATLAISSAAFGMAIVIFSQSVSASSWLYPVQKASDSLAIAAHPQYRATVMMKRAQQVNQLVAARAGSEQVLAVLADYTKQAGLYRTTPHANYAAFEFCRTNLRQAAAAAVPGVREAISGSLHALQNT